MYPLGFKSYAHLFYTAKSPRNSLHGKPLDWLLTGDIDKPAYFVCKIHQVQAYLQRYPQLKKIGQQNGYVFLKREK